MHATRTTMSLLTMALLTFLLLAAGVTPAVANNLTVKVSGQGLTIKGDADDNSLTIEQVGLPPTDLRIVPGMGTTINGIAGSQDFPGGAAGLKVDLGAGADAVALVGPLRVTGKVGIKTGPGGDGVSLVDVTIDAAATIDGGGDDDLLSITGTTFQANVTVIGGDGADALAISDMTVRGDARIPLGGGADAATLCLVDVAGKLVVDLGKGDAGTATSSCTGPVSLNGSVDRRNFFGGANLTVGGDFTLKGGKDPDPSALLASTVQGKGRIDLGGGNDGIRLCGIGIGGDLLIKMGQPRPGGSATVSCSSGGFVADATGDTAVAATELQVGGALTAKLGGGSDTFAVAGGGVQGGAKLDFGAGDNSVEYRAATFGAGLSVKSGKGSDVFRLRESTLQGTGTFTLGKGNNTVLVATTTLGGLTVKTGNGNDTIDTTSATVNGTRNIDGGGGGDVILP